MGNRTPLYRGQGNEGFRTSEPRSGAKRGQTVPYDVNGAPTSTTVASGTYTPTLTNTTNVAASVADQFHYLRVGSVVTVSGRVTCDPTTTGDTQLGISLPIASDFTALADCAGVGCLEANSNAGSVFANITANRAYLFFVAASPSNGAWAIHFTYIIK